MRSVTRVCLLAAIVSAGTGLGALRAQQPPAAPVPPPPCQPGDTQWVCGQVSPEDLVVVPGGQWVIASSYGGPGGLYAIRTSDRTSTLVYPTATAKEQLDRKTYDTCPGPPDAGTKAKFQTHGLYLQEQRNRRHRLYVVLHGGRESVEVFEVDARQATPVFTWIGCAVAPDPIGLNSVRALDRGGFIASNFLPRGGDATARGRLNAGEANGELWEWHTGTGWRKVPESQASGANGLEMSKDGKWLYVAAWGSQSFFRLSYGQAKVTREEVPLGFRVDNIRWAKDGSLLAAGQVLPPGPPTTVVVKVDPQTLRVRELLRRPNDPAFSNGTVAVEIGDSWWIGTFRGDRILVTPAAP